MAQTAEQKRRYLTPRTLGYHEVDPGDLPREVFLQYLQGASKAFADDMPEWAGWFLVAVPVGREAYAVDLLTDSGMDVWLPETTIERLKADRQGHKRSGRKRRVVSSEEKVLIFTGFVLVRFVPSAQAWHAIEAFRIVIGIAAGRAAFMPETPAGRRLKYALSGKAVARLFELEQEVQVIEEAPSLAKGENVRITEGPFAGFLAVGTGDRTAYGSVRVETSVFGRSTPVILDDSQYERV